MSMRSFNQLLGRSTIDPQIATAYEQGRIGEVLAEYEFSPALRTELANLHADSFEGYARLAYEVVRSAETPPPLIHLPDAIAGLNRDGSTADRKQVA
jgi:hypothetical protein